jgi:nucleoside-diphosphate-sugar epimerase
VIESLIAGHELPAAALGANRIVNLPGISVSVAEMVASLERIAGAEVVKRIEWRPDPAIERIVATWPPLFETTRARSLGFTGDDNFDDMVREFLRERGSSGPAVSPPSTGV